MRWGSDFGSRVNSTMWSTSSLSLLNRHSSTTMLQTLGHVHTDLSAVVFATAQSLGAWAQRLPSCNNIARNSESPRLAALASLKFLIYTQMLRINLSFLHKQRLPERVLHVKQHESREME